MRPRGGVFTASTVPPAASAAVGVGLLAALVVGGYVADYFVERSAIRWGIRASGLTSRELRAALRPKR
jgi:Na+/glutamate symporter